MNTSLEIMKEVGKRYNDEGSAERLYTGKFGNKHREARLQKQFDFVKGLNIKNETILDIGCGGGKYINLLAGHNTICGIDLSRIELRYAKSKFPDVSFVQASATHLPFKKNFTCVLIIEVLHHLDNSLLEVAASEISRVIKSGGKLICDLRNSLNPVMWYSYKKRDGKHYPLKTRSLGWLAGRLKSYGFSVTRKVGLFFPISAFAPYVMCVAVKDRGDT